MATQKIRPDEGFVDRQLQRQRRTSRNRKVGALALAAAIGVVAVILVIRAVDESAETQPAGQPTAQPIPSVGDGSSLEPGRYALEAVDPAFNASHRITIDVPDGYQGFMEGGVIGGPTTDRGVFLYDVGYSFADVCDWRGTQTPISSGDELVAALTGEQGLRPSPPTDAEVSGFAGTYMEITVPSRAKLDRCSAGRMQAWALQGDDGGIWLNNTGQNDLLWILDVDGVPLVIDAQLGASTTAEDRAELEQMVESIKIERT